jgi:hypothetical protein
VNIRYALKLLLLFRSRKHSAVNAQYQRDTKKIKLLNESLNLIYNRTIFRADGNLIYNQKQKKIETKFIIVQYLMSMGKVCIQYVNKIEPNVNEMRKQTNEIFFNANLVNQFA